MRTLLLSLFFAVNSFVVTAQIVFERSYSNSSSETGVSCIKTHDNKLVIAGNTFSGTGSDVFLVKTKDTGDTLWIKTLGGTGNDIAASLIETNDHGYMICGTSGDFSGNSDVMLIKTDSAGNLMWSKTFGGTSRDAAYSVSLTTEGGYMVAGSTKSFGNGGSDIYVINVDAEGDIIWSKTYGGSFDDEAASVGQTTDGGYFIAGTMRNSLSDSTDICLLKIDSEGNTSWVKNYGGEEHDFARNARNTSNGGFIITGGTQSFGSGNENVYVINTDSNGNLLWSQMYGGSGCDIGNSIMQTTNNGYIIAGQTNSFADSVNIYLVRIDSTGNVVWTKSIGGSGNEKGNSVLPYMNGFVVAGETNSHVVGDKDLYLVKTSQNGITACYNKSIPVITAPINSVVSIPANIQSFLPSTYIYSNIISVSTGGNSFTGCYDNLSLDVLTATTLNLPTENSSIVIRGSIESVPVSELSRELSFNVFPNPGNGSEINALVIAEEYNEIRMVIYDVTGKQHFSKTMVAMVSGENVFAINPENKLAPGIYFITASSRKETISRKLVIQ